jgi:hypothetical protein
MVSWILPRQYYYETVDAVRDMEVREGETREDLIGEREKALMNVEMNV